MKKLYTVATILLVTVMLLTMSACGGKDSAKGSEMSLKEIMSYINDGVDDLPNVGEIELDAESFEYYAFIEYIEGAEGLVSEALVSAQPHSVVLIRLPESADAQSVADEIKANANPAKWVCVEAEKTEVVCHGSTILLVMSFESTTDAISANFNELF